MTSCVILTEDDTMRHVIDIFGILAHNADARRVILKKQPSMLPQPIQHILQTEYWHNANYARSWLTNNENTQKHKKGMWEYRDNNQFTDCCIEVDDENNSIES